MLELAAILVSGVATIVTIVYKAGQLEGKVVTKLEEHDRRIAVLERRASPVYERL